MNQKEMAFTFMKQLAVIESDLVSINERKNKMLLSESAWHMRASELQEAEHAIKKLAIAVFGTKIYNMIENWQILSKIRAMANNRYVKIMEIALDEYELLFGTIKDIF